MFESLRKTFEETSPEAELVTLRFLRERDDVLAVRQGVVQPVQTSENMGVMVTVHHEGGAGYAATDDLTAAGLRRAGALALEWARRTAPFSVTDFRKVDFGNPEGEYVTPVERPWSSMSTAEKIDRLRKESERLHADEKIVDWEASFWNQTRESVLMRKGGGTVHQTFHVLIPELKVVAHGNGETVVRTFGGFRLARQGGLEILDRTGYWEAAPRLAAQAVELLSAPDCPTGRMDLLLMPDQMILQIHESIGHPLELDRILGDERNYAGTSFVTPDMFGRYRYGSDLLNITFDPTLPEEVASYRWDDDGRPATKAYLIRKGILERPLGGTVSQVRAGTEGTANSRACSWNRPPIDRMANLNLEPGESTFEELLGGVEKGVCMEGNCSWSIDDSRNKFQFGCEYGRRIENGELKEVVKKPNYRGISAVFWRSLAGVGDRSTRQVLGTPYCGKGEPNQGVFVGHASPAALFTGVDVFGGA